MKKKSDFDYLHSLVREQIKELRQLGPIAYDILRALLPPTGAIDVKNLVNKVIQDRRPVVQVDPDGLQLRAAPEITAPVLKSMRQQSQLILLDPGSEEAVGTRGRWLHVLEMDGNNGYVEANYVSRVKSYQDPSAIIDMTMNALEYFNRLDFVDITQENDNFRVTLTPKGKNMADLLFQPD